MIIPTAIYLVFKNQRELQFSVPKEFKVKMKFISSRYEEASEQSRVHTWLPKSRADGQGHWRNGLIQHWGGSSDARSAYEFRKKLRSRTDRPMDLQ